MLCVLAGVVTAQQVRIVAPVGGAIIAPEKSVLELDVGVAVQMFESPNLDRYLRRAKECLAREDFVQAIKILQDVVEGRTLEAGDQGDSGAAATDSKQVGLEPEAGLKQDGPQQIAKAKSMCLRWMHRRRSPRSRIPSTAYSPKVGGFIGRFGASVRS